MSLLMFDKLKIFELIAVFARSANVKATKTLTETPRTANQKGIELDANTHFKSHYAAQKLYLSSGGPIRRETSGDVPASASNKGRYNETRCIIIQSNQAQIRDAGAGIARSSAQGTSS